MFKDKKNSTIPDIDFKVFVEDEWRVITTQDLFKNQKVIVFSLPGAFTPTCSSAHLPRYNQLAEEFFANGVDRILCVSVNDTFVMNAWAKDQKADNIQFIPDGNGEFTDAMNMLVDKSDIGFGQKRSWRYSMLVNDGTIEKMFIEPEVEGDPFEVSDADTMINYINPDAVKRQSITIVTKPGCGHCDRAKTMLGESGYKFEEIDITADGYSLSTLIALSGAQTTPQVFIDGNKIGGADDLEKWLKEQK